MITKTYICDMCKKSVGETELHQVSTTLHLLRHSNGYAGTITVSKDVCKDCLKKHNISVEVPEGEKYDDVAAKDKKVLADKLIDILEDLGVQFTE